MTNLVLNRSLASLLVVVCLALEVGYAMENTLSQHDTHATIRASDHDFNNAHVWLVTDEIEENSEGKSKEHTGLDVLVARLDHISRLPKAKSIQNCFLTGWRIIAHNLKHRVLRI